MASSILKTSGMWLILIHQGLPCGKFPCVDEPALLRSPMEIWPLPQESTRIQYQTSAIARQSPRNGTDRANLPPPPEGASGVCFSCPVFEAKCNRPMRPTKPTPQAEARNDGPTAHLGALLPLRVGTVRFEAHVSFGVRVPHQTVEGSEDVRGGLEGHGQVLPR